MLTWSLKRQTFFRFINHLQGKQNKTRIGFIYSRHLLCICSSNTFLCLLTSLVLVGVGYGRFWFGFFGYMPPSFAERYSFPAHHVWLLFLKMHTQRHHGGLPLWGDVSASPFLWPFLPVLFVLILYYLIINLSMGILILYILLVIIKELRI